MRVENKVKDVFSKTYRERQFVDTVLQLGTSKWSRQAMYEELHCGHTVAALRVSATLSRMGVHTVRQIIAVPLMDWARVEGFGEAALRVLLDLIGGQVSDADLDQWLTAELRGHKLVQWNAICAQAQKKARKRGKHRV